MITKIFGKSWKTSILGSIAIVLGIWSLKLHWVPHATVFFNIVYVAPGSLALIFSGWLGLHARDHSTSEKAHSSDEKINN